MKKLIKYLLYSISFLILALFIIGAVNTNSFKEGSLDFTPSWQGKFITIEGEKIRYIQKGTGKNVFLIHGTPGSIEDWQPIIDSLSLTYKVTAFDRPGNGFSTANNYDYSLEFNARMANKLIKELKLDSVVVVGHSYGGSIAAYMATAKSDNIKSYIIVASPLYQFNPDALYKAVTAPIIGKGLTVLISKTIVSQKIEEGLSDSFGGNKEILTAEFLNIRKQLWSQPKVLYSTSKERMNYSKDLNEISPQYKLIDIKVSILVGDKDHPHIIEDCKRLQKDIPNADFYFLEDTAHFIQFEKTYYLLEIIKNHL
ncbi:MAG: alpha/beta hydrolase [Flavobacteriaceae bacterium]|nr:alpha/beta hydrolase [Flavobacteriaceae bacterium]